VEFTCETLCCCYLGRMPRPPFRSLFCERFQCASSDYEEKAFRKCLYFHARLLAPLIRRINPDFFFEDFKFIAYLGSSTGIREVSADVLNFNDANRANRSLWRTGLRIRVSGRKATRLAYDLFTEARQADALQART